MKKRTIISIIITILVLTGLAATILTQAAAIEDLPFAENGILDTAELFTERDLAQEPDLANAVSMTVSDGDEIRIAEEGVYILTGTASEATVYVEADQEAKIQLVLDSLTITNQDFPCIYIKSADKVFVTTVSDSSLSVSSTFAGDGDTHTDGVIFSKSDLVLNGTAALSIRSSDNGIVCKDDLKITGGSYVIESASKCIEANDSIRIAGGTFSLTAGTDALHAENDEDDSLGYLYICGGDFSINAGDDGIHAEAVLEIDAGTFEISAAEGLEATYIQINDGTILIQSTDDGVNAAAKSSAYRTALEINGGELTVLMSSGDTDGIDSNGDLIVNGGTIDVSGPSTFDCDGSVMYNGGTIIVNGQQVSSIPLQGGGRSRGGSRG